MSSSHAASVSVSAAAPRSPGLAALLVMLSGTFMVVLDFFIVNVALPSIQHDLHAGSAALQWIVIGYGLATAVGLISGGRLGDIHGRRRIFMLGIALFAATSALCGLAPTAAVLVGARIAQGAAGALLLPQVTAMLGVVYSGERRARAFAAYGLALGLGAASGQLIGGLLIHANLGGLGWRSCFLINLPIGGVALLLATRLLPAPPAQRTSRLDAPGAALLALALTALLLPLVQGRDAGWPAWSLVALAASLPLFVLFWRQQRHVALRGGQPLLAPRLMTQRGFALGLWVTLVFYAGNASLYFVLALYLQRGLGLSPLDSGLVFTALAAGFFATSMAAPRLGRWLGRQAIFAGACVLALGHALMAALVSQAAVPSMAAIVPVLVIQGCGLGMVMAPLVATLLAGLPAEHAGVAAGVLATVQQLGNALGVALIGMVFYGVGESPSPAAAIAGFAPSLAYLLATSLIVAVLHRRFTTLAKEASS
jgi:EmrB/QacA subfamily drug resistance transporter